MIAIPPATAAAALAFLFRGMLYLGVLLAVGGGLYNAGKTAGERKVQALWDKAIEAAEEETQRIRNEGFVLAKKYRQQVREMERRYEAADRNIHELLQRPLICPASGKLGDVVVPAAVVDSLFGDDTVAPGSATAGPD